MPERLRLTLIDDNPLDRALILRELENEIRNVHAFTIGDAAEFANMLDGPEPDVVITDHSLGWSNGIEVVKKCKSRWPYCPIIMFTGSGGEEVAVEGMKAGLDDYIVKAPQQYYKLRAAVSRSLRLAEAKRKAAMLQKEREELLARETELRKAAEQASRLKDEFLATVSHELRTPLTPILGWVKILRDRKFKDPMIDRALEVIERNVSAQTHIIEDLLDVSRIITGKLKLSFSEVDVQQLVRAAVTSIHPTADAKGIAVEVHPCVIDGTIVADAARLQQVLWNLLSNAIKFTSSGGRIDVECKQVDGEARISITDNGEGIDPGFAPYLFERFTQADGSTTRKHGGLGLGLAIVRHIVELHGGSVSASSKGKGHGARFDISLPVRKISERPAVGIIPADHVSNNILRGTTVLVVDDDRDTRELLQFGLQNFGATCVAAGNAKDGLKMMEDHAAAIVVSDIGMEEYDGLWLVRELKIRHPHTPVIALTAYAREVDESAATTNGFDAFVTKPVDLGSLAALIAEQLRSRITQRTTK